MIARETGFNWRAVRKWTRQDAVRPQATMAPKSTMPGGFGAYLAERWNEGCTIRRQLVAEIRPLGYTGSLTNLQQRLNGWRRAQFAAVITSSPPDWARLPDGKHRIHVPPIVASTHCIKPGGLLTKAQCKKVDDLKEASIELAAMRAFAKRFRGLLRRGNIELLYIWLQDPASSGFHPMRQFAATLRRDIGAVGNAIVEPWSNGRTERQINRLKTLKRAMYGRASAELLRTRMHPLYTV
ncbi:transposase [Acidisoma silvae]|uniref:Transposase n=1 Tax=Acidisoma silvae TaxID=2802396 RepID=A0A963YWV4_9PROT|nr:transposase [Acidisoma silvae]MCB8878365.1 transposase [Acidisoma silvae]